MSLSLNSILNEQDIQSIPVNIQTQINCVLESKCKSLDFEKQRCSLLEKDYNDLKTKVEYQSDLVNRYKGHITQLEDDLHKSRRELCDSNHEKDCLNVELKNLNMELISKDDQVTKLNELVLSKNEEIMKMIESNHKLQMELEQEKIDTRGGSFNEQQIQNLLTQKESLFNLERNHLKEELDRTTQDFHETCSKLSALTSEFTFYKNETENQLNDLKKEHNVLKGQNTFLNNLIEKKDNQIGDLAMKLNELHQHQDMLKEQFESQEKEQVDLINCYKKSLDESKIMKNELVEKIKELHASFIESNENHKAAVEKYNHQCARFAEELRSKDDLNMELRQKIEDLESQLVNMSRQELDNSMKQFYPTSTTLSKMFDKNMPLSTVYTKYEELQVKCGELANENAEFRLKIQEMIAESEQNAPLIFYKTQENKKAFAEIEDYKTQLTKVSTDLENALSEIENYNKINNYLKRELKRYEKSNIDLSRQVECLIQTVHEIKGNFVSSKFLVNDQFLESESPFDKAVSINLVTFKNIEEIHDNNQKLLSSIRELSEQYHELQDKFRNRNDDEESRKHIDKLLVEIENLKEENRHKQEILSEMMSERESKLNQSGKHETGLSKDKQTSGSTLFKITSRAYLEEKIVELTNSLEKRNIEFEQYKNRAQMLDDQLKAEIKSYVEEISQKQTEISKLTVKFESLEENNKMLDSKLAQYNKEKGMLKERNIKLEEQRKILKERIGTFESKKNELIVKLNEMKKELDSQVKSSNFLEKENNHLKIESGMIKKILEELKKELKESQNELALTKTEYQIGSVKNECDLKNQIQMLDLKNSNMQNTLTALTNEKKILNEKLVETKKQFQLLRQKMFLLTTENNSAIQEKNRVLVQFKECQDKLKEIEHSADDSATKTKAMKAHLEMRNQLEEKNKEIFKLIKERNDLIEKLKLKETALRQADHVNKQQIELYEQEVESRMAQANKKLEESELRERVFKNRYEQRLKKQHEELTELRQFKQQVISNEFELQQQQQQSASTKQESQSIPTVASYKPNTATIKPITVHSRLQQTVATLPQAAVTPTQTISNINSPQTAYVVPTSVEQSASESTIASLPAPQTSFSTSSSNIQQSPTPIVQQNILPSQSETSSLLPIQEQSTTLENNNLKRQRMISFEDFNPKKQKLSSTEQFKSKKDQTEQVATSTSVVSDQESMGVFELQPQQEESTTVETQTELQPLLTASNNENVIEMQTVFVSTDAQEEILNQVDQDRAEETQQTNEEITFDKTVETNDTKDENDNQEDESADEEDEQMYEDDEVNSDESRELDDEEGSELDDDENRTMQTNSQSNTQDKDQSSDVICLDDDRAGDENTRDSKIASEEESSSGGENLNEQEECDQATASLGILLSADLYSVNYQEEANQQEFFQQEDSSSQPSKDKTISQDPSMPTFAALDKVIQCETESDRNVDFDNLIIDEQQQAADEQTLNDEQQQDQGLLTFGLVTSELTDPTTTVAQPINTQPKSIFSNLPASNQETSTSFLPGQSTSTDQASQSKKPGKLKRPIISKINIQQQKNKPNE